MRLYQLCLLGFHTVMDLNTSLHQKLDQVSATLSKSNDKVSEIFSALAVLAYANEI